MAAWAVQAKRGNVSACSWLDGLCGNGHLPQGRGSCGWVYWRNDRFLGNGDLDAIVACKHRAVWNGDVLQLCVVQGHGSRCCAGVLVAVSGGGCAQGLGHADGCKRSGGDRERGRQVQRLLRRDQSHRDGWIGQNAYHAPDEKEDDHDPYEDEKPPLCSLLLSGRVWGEWLRRDFCDSAQKNRIGAVVFVIY